MHAGAFGRENHFFRVDRTESSDVLAHAAGKQFYILRQITDVRAEHVLVGGKHIGAIQAYMAGGGRPYPDNQARQRRLAGPAWADDPKHVSGNEGKPQAFYDGSLRPRRGRGHGFERNMPQWIGQAHADFARRVVAKQGLQTKVGAAGTAPGPPGVDHLLDRIQGSAHQHRSNNHHATGDFSLEHQQRGKAKDQRLEGNAHEFCSRTDNTCLFAGLRLELQEAAMHLDPARQHVGQHAHCFNHLRIAQIIGRMIAGDNRHGAGFGKRFS